MDGSHACLCPKLLHVWSVGRPADCSDCDSEDACGGASFGTSRGLLVTTDDGSKQAECVCQCTGLFTGLSCNVSLTKHLPVSPGAGVGITLGAVAAIGVVMACLLCRGGFDREMTAKRAQRLLLIEFADWLLDWITFALAFHAADLRFHNDPTNIMRDFIMALCVLSTVSWFLEFVLFLRDNDAFRAYGQCFNFAHLLVEDGMQVVLYSIAASGNASSGAEDNALQVFVLIAAGIQSLLFFLAKGYELFSEQRENLVAVVDPRHSTTGIAGAELPAVGGAGRRI